MNKDRLLKLADHLETVDMTTFNMGVWREEDSDSPCGTVACAAGHACRVPEFQELGLSIRDMMGFFDLTYEQAEWLFMPEQYRHLLRGDEYNPEQAQAIILSITPHEVARRIRRLVREHHPHYQSATPLTLNSF